jgi:hypothetical protein
MQQRDAEQGHGEQAELDAYAENRWRVIRFGNQTGNQQHKPEAADDGGNDACVQRFSPTVPVRQ